MDLNFKIKNAAVIVTINLNRKDKIMYSDIWKTLLRIFKNKNINEVMNIDESLRKEQLKGYTTKELIKELKKRGINMPKKYK